MSPPAASRTAVGLLAFAIGVFIVAFPLIVIALRDFGPATATLVRMVLGGAVLAFAARGQMAGLRGSRLRVAAIGAFGLGLQSWLLAYAMTHVGGALPALVLGLEPIVIGLVGSLVVGEHVGARLRAAFLIGLAGEAVISGALTAGAAERPLLPLLALAGVVTLFSAYSVSLRQLADLPSAAVVCLASIGGAVAVLPLAAIEVVRGDAVHSIHAGRVAALVFAAVFASGLGYLAWAAALSRVRAAVAALGLYLVPIGGAVSSHIILGEPLYARHAVGAAIVIAAVLIARSRSHTATPPAIDS